MNIKASASWSTRHAHKFTWLALLMLMQRVQLCDNTCLCLLDTLAFSRCYDGGLVASEKIVCVCVCSKSEMKTVREGRFTVFIVSGRNVPF